MTETPPAANCGGSPIAGMATVPTHDQPMDGEGKKQTHLPTDGGQAACKGGQAQPHIKKAGKRKRSRTKAQLSPIQERASRQQKITDLMSRPSKNPLGTRLD